MRLTFDEIKRRIKRVLVKYGMSEEKAETCARIHTETYLRRGIFSTAPNRVARLVKLHLRKGWVDVNAGRAFPWSGSLAPPGFIMETWGPAS